MAALIPPVVAQLDELRREYPGAHWEDVPGGGGMVRVVVPGFRLPSGWSADEATVQFILPIGYPVARPDCFWTKEILRLEDGRTPIGTGTNQMPGTSEPLLWFSWHVDEWDSKADLLKWLKVIGHRFEKRQ